jgi:uncharacterized protein YraI
MKRMLWSVAVCLGFLVPAAVLAADGYVTGNVNLRAGPDPGYPAVTMIDAGTPVSIQGCTDGWTWCDVIADGTRGWIAGDFLQYEYQNQRVYVPAYGARIGIPIVSFVLGSYWGSHYRSRPWYGQRSRWSHYRPKHAYRPSPRPPVHRPPVRPQPGHRPPNGMRPPTHRPSPATRPVVNRRPAATRPAPHRPATGARPSTQRPAVTRPAQSKSHQPAARPLVGQHGGNARPASPARGSARPAAKPATRKPPPDRSNKKKDNNGH